jgi:predicted nucleic acid-binding Zn finger protein
LRYRDLDSFIRKNLKELTDKNGNVLEEIKSLFKERAKQLEELLTNGAFIEHIDENRVHVLTNNGCYLVEKYYYCSCDDFFYNNLLRKKLKPCKHMLFVLYHDAQSKR